MNEKEKYNYSAYLFPALTKSPGSREKKKEVRERALKAS